MLATSRECDTFTDSYGCVITSCSGYQVPFPVVRLGCGANADRIPCVVAANPHLLIELDFESDGPCTSFLQLLSSKRKPVRVSEHGAHFIKRVTATQNHDTVTTCGEGHRWFTSVLLRLSSSVARATLPGVLAASVCDDTLWCLDGASIGALTRWNVEYLFARQKLPNAITDRPSPINHCDVVALTTMTALVFDSCGVSVVDARLSETQQRAVLFPTTLSSGGTTASGLIIGVTEKEGLVVVYDQRRSDTPLFSMFCGAEVMVRPHSAGNLALLLSGCQVGILDTVTLTVLGALQPPDHDILDATVMSCYERSIRVCSSASNGMLYDWYMCY